MAHGAFSPGATGGFLCRVVHKKSREETRMRREFTDYEALMTTPVSEEDGISFFDSMRALLDDD